jgi:multisubunit Na+/H+ antiporter MnhG subunit
MATKGNFFGIAFVIIAAMLINLLVLFSVNFFGSIISIFILFTLPMTVLIFANVYNQLTKSTSEDFSQRKALRIEDEIMESTGNELI